MKKNNVIISAISFIAGILITLAATNFSSLTASSSDTEIVFGDKNAPVELIGFISLDCPHCAQFHKDFFPKIKSELIDTGKIKYVLKPFTGNQNSLQGMMLVQCSKQNQRVALINNLFSNTQRWLKSDTSELKAIAAENGIDARAFNSCIENKKIESSLLASKQDAQKYNIKGAPSFVLNGEKLELANNADDIISAVNEISAGKSPNESFKEKLKVALVVTEADKFIDNANAPVTIIEYASLSCQHCAKFHTETFPQLKKEFIDTGKVKLVFRNFPLNEPALKAAMIAECVGSENYFSVLEKLFQTQKDWSFDKETYLAKLSVIARSFGINQQELDTCLANKEIENRIVESRMIATSKVGVSSTPAFFINGTKGDHLHSVQEFKQAIEAAK